MKPFIVAVFFCSLPGLRAQSVKMVSSLNEPVTLYVDGHAGGGGLSVGNHVLQARYSNGAIAAEQSVYFPEGYSYRWEIKPPAVKLLIKRTARIKAGKLCTQGELFVDDNPSPFCKTLELPFENNNNNRSCIAVGSYSANVRSTSKHPDGVIQLNNVRSMIYYNDNGSWRTGSVNRNAGGSIEIHSGNSPANTKGCILLGQAFSPTDECWITDSRNTLHKLYHDFFDADAQGRPNRNVEVTVTIQLDYP